MSPSSLFGTIQPRPKFYRGANGAFRKETRREFRARHDKQAWAHHQSNKKQWEGAVKAVASFSPFEALFGKVCLE